MWYITQHCNWNGHFDKHGLQERLDVLHFHLSLCLCFLWRFSHLLLFASCFSIQCEDFRNRLPSSSVGWKSRVQRFLIKRVLRGFYIKQILLFSVSYKFNVHASFIAGVLELLSCLTQFQMRVTFYSNFRRNKYFLRIERKHFFSGKYVLQFTRQFWCTCLKILLQWTLVTTTAFVPKDVAIKTNLLLYRILNEQTDM